MKPPAFWDKSNHFLSKILKPFGWIYAYGTARRFRKTKPYQTSIPVICVGNISVGGTGKTPVCLAIAGLLHKQKKNSLLKKIKTSLKNLWKLLVKVL